MKWRLTDGEKQCKCSVPSDRLLGVMNQKECIAAPTRTVHIDNLAMICINMIHS